MIEEHDTEDERIGYADNYARHFTPVNNNRSRYDNRNLHDCRNYPRVH